jgi:hypothetical protein
LCRILKRHILYNAFNKNKSKVVHTEGVSIFVFSLTFIKINTLANTASKYRVSISDLNETKITIPTPFSVGEIILISFGVAIPLFLFNLVLGIFTTEMHCHCTPTKSLLLALVPVIFFGLFLINALQELIWHLLGSEIFVLDNHTLKVSRKMVLFYRTKVFELNQIHNFRTGEYPYNRKKRDFMLLMQYGTILFEYHNKTICIGRELSETKALEIAEIFKNHSKKLCVNPVFSF